MPDPQTVSIAAVAASTSSARTTSPAAFTRSGMPRVSSREASGAGLSMTIQPNSGPGVQDFARCSVYSKPCVTRSPTRAPFPSRTALVATVVPCSTSEMSDGLMPALAQISRTPLATPIDWSSGVEGVLASKVRRPTSSCSRRSVKVPPTSTPSLIVLLLRNALAGHGLRTPP